LDGKVPAGYRRLLDEYVSLLLDHFGRRLISVCLFGSVARGEDDVESDVDVLVVAEGLPEDAGLRTRETNWIHLKLRETEAYRLLRASGRNCLISDVFFTPEEVERHPPVLLDIVEDGVILYDKNGFLRNVLEGLSEKLRRMGARRIKAGKGRYWILKPGAEPPEVVEI